MRELLIVLSIVLSVNVNAQTTDWVKSFGGVNSDKGISIGTDSLGFIYISGFYNSEATFDAITFSKQAEENGAGEILLTSMDKDGTKTGYDLELLNKITSTLSIPVIASGGAGKLEHLYESIKTGGASAVLAASIFHYGEFTIKETKEYLKLKNVPVRL